MAGDDVFNGQLGACFVQSIKVHVSELGDFIGVVRKLGAGEILGIVGIAFRRVNKHVREEHLIETVRGNLIVALDGIVNKQEGKERVGVVTAGLRRHGAVLQLDIQIGQEVGGNGLNLADKAQSLDRGIGADQNITAAAGNDQRVDVGIGLDNGLCGLAAGVGGGAAVLGLKKLELVIGMLFVPGLNAGLVAFPAAQEGGVARLPAFEADLAVALLTKDGDEGLAVDSQAILYSSGLASGSITRKN